VEGGIEGGKLRGRGSDRGPKGASGGLFKGVGD